MKNLMLIMQFMILAMVMLAQPQAFKYQTIIRDAGSELVTDQAVALRIDILTEAPNGAVVYTEDHTVTTNEFGLVNLEIGKGTVVFGVFSEIDWGSGDHFLKLSLDISGGSNFVFAGVTQLLSVPYALYARESGDGSVWQSNGNNIYYSAGNVGIGTAQPGSLLDVHGGTRFTVRLDNETRSKVGNLYSSDDTLSLVSFGNVEISIDDNNNSTNKAFRVINNGNSELFRVQDNGNVGVGTSNPAYRFHMKYGDAMIEDTSWCDFKIKATNEGKDPALQLYAGDDYWAFNHDDSEENDLDIRFNNSTKLSIETDGRVGIGTGQPDPSALLQVYSTSKGFLPPRMNNTQIAAIQNPANGLMVYNTSDGHPYVFNTSDYKWKRVAYDTQTITPQFNCGGLLFDSRDGKYYQTVQIGTQCWMAENLNYAGINNSDCYNEDPIFCEEYGRLYEEGGDDPCPPGWHQPVDSEWCTLGKYLDPTFNCTASPTPANNAGGKLKETGFLHWNAPNSGASNQTGFKAIGAGVRDMWYQYPETYWGLNETAIFFTGMNYPADTYYSLNYNSASLIRGDWSYPGKLENFYAAGSVRCVKD